MGRVLGLKEALRPVSGFRDSVDKLVALTITAALFADFCRGLEEGIFRGCSGNLHPDVDGSYFAW